MRIGRAKAARKALTFYRINGDFVPPYKVICDGNFVVASFRYKIPLKERIRKVLQGCNFTLFVTRSTLNELEQISSEEIFINALNFIKEDCNIIENNPIQELSEDKTKELQHIKNSKPSIDIFKLVHDANLEKYFVATQDELLGKLLRKLPIHVPLLHIKKTVLTLESPSSSSFQLVSNVEKSKLVNNMMKQEQSIVTKVKEEERKKKRKRFLEEQEKLTAERNKNRIAKFRPKAKGPNPLSCKKKKAEDSTPKKKKRQRRKKSENETTSI